jgi:hypothetical protein
LYRELLRDGRFFELLLRVDEEKAEQVQAAGCPHCHGPLHAAHFARKPRGLLASRDALPGGHETRFDWCCGWCRQRTLPASVRFLGRKVYVAVAIAVATVLVRGRDRDAVRILRRELGASWSTLRRWRQWWRALTGSAFWERLRGKLPVDLDGGALPGSLLDRFDGSPAERMLRLLRLLASGDGSDFPSALAGSR